MEFNAKLDLFLADLSKLESEQANALIISQKSINLCQTLLLELKSDITNSPLESAQDEIHFFKVVKNLPLSKLIYFSEIKSFETYFPKMNGKTQKKFIRRKISFLNQYFLRHIDFGQYVELGSTYLDKLYYTRNSNDYDTYYFAKGYLLDPDFCTPRDFLLAEFNARKNLVIYINYRLSKQKQSADFIGSSQTDTRLKWTGSKSALTELIYALHCNRAINNGNAEIKDLANSLEHLFHFDLGDYYRTFSEIKSRKKSRTKFLDDLSTSLQNEMDSSEK